MLINRLRNIGSVVRKLSVNRKILCDWRQSSSATPAVTLQASCLEVNISECIKPLQLDYMWLRDHCRCKTCYNKATQQRILDLRAISTNIKPLKYEIEASQLKVQWNDGHESCYQVAWLTELCNPQHQQRCLNSLYDARKLWPENKPPAIPQVTYKELIAGAPGVIAAVKYLLEYGIVTIAEVPATMENTQIVVESISPVQFTFFGGMWEFGLASAGDAIHEDTAYTNYALDPHNDCTYFTESIGLQVFHCLERPSTNKGGETILVDGIAAASHLAKYHPEEFKILSSVVTESEYKEAGKHYLSSLPTIVLDPVVQHILQIRFNLYDRAPLRTISCCTDIRKYYMALRLLSKVMLDGRFATKLVLSPGTVLILDNWRILHGRTAFTGRRHIGGCYVSRSDWLSKARVLGLLH